jgi:hypothetical protein
MPTVARTVSPPAAKSHPPSPDQRRSVHLGAVVAGGVDVGQNHTSHPDPSLRAVPATTRLLLGISYGDRVLVMAIPEQDTLPVYPMPTVARMLTAVDTPNNGDASAVLGDGV